MTLMAEQQRTARSFLTHVFIFMNGCHNTQLSNLSKHHHRILATYSRFHGLQEETQSLCDKRGVESRELETLLFFILYPSFSNVSQQAVESVIYVFWLKTMIQVYIRQAVPSTNYYLVFPRKMYLKMYFILQQFLHFYIVAKNCS